MSQKENIVIVGYGWVGQANALALTKMGWPVFYYDIVPPVLKYIDRHAELYGKVKPLESVLELDSENTWYIVSVGDRVLTEGEQDISLIKKATDNLKGAKGKMILRSTVLPQNLEKLDFDFYIPEFLHEKNAVTECLNPFYFVLGKRNEALIEPKFVEHWQMRAKKVFKGTPEQASYIKYLSNIWNAVRISFINEFGDLAQNNEEVIDFIFEKKNYLRYGKAFGGHCLPKDLLAFYAAHASKRSPELLRAAYVSNDLHKTMTAQYTALPEWFSSWEDETRSSGDIGTAAFLWNKFNSSPPTQIVRKRLRFLVDTLSRLTPERSLEDVRNIWNGLAKKNARYFVNTKTPSGKDVNEFELKETGLADFQKYVLGDAALASIFKKSLPSVLEVGCGLGRMTEFFPQHFARVAAIDISDAMLESAKKRLSDLKNVELKLTDGRNIDYPADSFDLAFSYQTLQHVPARTLLADAFSEIYRILRPGGVAKLHLRTGRGLYKWHWAYGASVTPMEAKTLAEAASFKFIKHEIEDPKSLWIWLEKKF